jgi:sulfate-transporting ATPase
MYDPRVRRDRAMALLAQVEMAHQANKLPSAVSGGQQQRVAIARALANDPPILVADGKTVLMVTHDSDLAKRVGRAVIVADGEIVNEYVAKALSTLSVDQLGYVMQQLEARTYTPGAPIISQGEPADQFYIITRGQVEILLHHPDGQAIVVMRLSAGQYFGEIGLLRGGARTASVRAAGEASVEVVALDRRSVRSDDGSDRPRGRSALQGEPRRAREGGIPCLAHAGAKCCATCGATRPAPSLWCSRSPARSPRST